MPTHHKNQKSNSQKDAKCCFSNSGTHASNTKCRETCFVVDFGGVGEVSGGSDDTGGDAEKDVEVVRRCG